jgi:hypothetical protein
VGFFDGKKARSTTNQKSDQVDVKIRIDAKIVKTAQVGRENVRDLAA